MKISFIGAGNMAEAIVGGLLDSGLLPASNIALADVSSERLASLSSSLGVTAASSNADAVAGADVVVLSVKPQVMDGVLADLKEALSSDQLVVSIAAGLTTAWLDDRMPGEPRLLRVMPNTPALVKQGMSCIAQGPRATAEDIALTQKIFEAVGHVAVVAEPQMDAVTALSGSGPAYVFYLMEHMEAVAAELGMSADLASELVSQTVLGAASLRQQSSDSPELLRERVTSKGGTTAAAIQALDKGSVGACIQEAVRAAAARSRELSGE